MRRFITGKKVKAYFTVEAAMVFPIVLWIILFVMRMMLFYYDRCLMEQDVASLFVKGMTLQVEDMKDLEDILSKEMAKQSEKRFVAWTLSEKYIVIQKGVVKANCEGKLNMGGRESWAAQVDYEGRRMQPTLFLRALRRLAQESME